MDTSFNGTGSIITPDSHAYSVAIQPDGKIVVGGDNGVYYENITTFRYNADGSPDTSFGGTGRVATILDVYFDPDYGYSGNAFQVAIQSDGKIVVEGELNTFITSYYHVIIRHNPNGSRDTTFGVNGVIYQNYSPFGGDVAIQPDGKIVTVGSLYNSPIDFAVARYNQYGSPDTTFNGTGIVTTDFGSQDEALAVALQADGKIVAAGFTVLSLGSNNGFALARYQGGSNANIRTRFDFDGDSRADVSIFRASDRVWYLNQSTNGFYATQFGLSTDKITPADFDGDGKTDIAVFRDGTWYLLRSTEGFAAIQFGLTGDTPVPADYTGDGRAELAVYRNGMWYTFNLSNNQISSVQFGVSTDKPVAADYDGDSRADYAVFRNGIWYLLRSTQGFAAIQFGLPGDKLVPADYDGDGHTDQAVYRDGVWYLNRSTEGFTAIQFGAASDTPVPADFDGDGRADIAVWRGSTWYRLNSSNSQFVTTQFGLANDKPVQAAFLP